MFILVRHVADLHFPELEDAVAVLCTNDCGCCIKCGLVVSRSACVAVRVGPTQSTSTNSTILELRLDIRHGGCLTMDSI